MSKYWIAHFIITLSFISVEGVDTKKYPQIVVEPDQTDIFAIPLDEDADEQQEELYNLEHPREE